MADAKPPPEESSVQATEESEETYPFWCTGLGLRWLFSSLLSKPWQFGFIAFAVYWGLPFVFSLFSGTTVTREAMIALIDGLPPFVTSLGLHDAFLRFQRIETGLAYLNDTSHFVYAILLLPSGWAAASILCKISTTVEELRSDGLPIADRGRAKRIYTKWQRFGNHWAFRVASLFLAVVTTIFFLNFYVNDEYSFWWGHRSYGLGGLLFAVIAAYMVYFGTQIMILTASASVMFAQLFSGEVVLRPFHPDGANGLVPLGRMIMLLWLLALAIAAEVCVVLLLGYLGIERMPLTWILALAGTLSVPTLAIVPLSACLRAIHRARVSAIGQFEPLLNSMLRKAETRVAEGRHDEAAEILTNLSDVCGVHDALTSLNVWPFNPRALVLVISVYALQLVLTLKEFFGQ